MKNKFFTALVVALLFGSVSIRIHENMTASKPVSLATTPSQALVGNSVATVQSAVAIVPEASAQTTPAPEKPAHIVIPTGQVKTDIIPVGVTATNNLDVPKNYVQVGWYENGPMPGQFGSAVLDGHVDNGGSIPGPFKHLRDVKVGDDIQIVTEKGTTLHFTVTSADVYQTDAFPSDKIFNDNSGNLIKLITCHGTFVKSKGTYDQRLVVTAKLAS